MEHLGLVYEALVKKLDPDDEFILDDKPIINGAVGKKLTRKPRQSAIEARKDGEFEILER